MTLLTLAGLGLISAHGLGEHCAALPATDVCFGDAACTVDFERERCRPKDCRDLGDVEKCGQGESSLGCEWHEAMSFCNKAGTPLPCYLFWEEGTCPKDHCREVGVNCMEQDEAQRALGG